MIKKKVCYVVRGLPGSGNWDLGFQIAKENHAPLIGLDSGVSLDKDLGDVVVVVGTFAQLHELRPVRSYAGQFGYDLVIVEPTLSVSRDPVSLIQMYPGQSEQILRAAERWEHLRV
jgi:hypothetical protein